MAVHHSCAAVEIGLPQILVFCDGDTLGMAPCVSRTWFRTFSSLNSPQQRLFQAACVQRWPWLASTLAWSHCGHHLWHHYLGNWQALCCDGNRANSTCTLELSVPVSTGGSSGGPLDDNVPEVSRSCVQSPWTPFPGRDLQLRINAYPVGNRRMTTTHLSAYVEVLPPEKHSDWHVALDFTFVMKTPGVSGRHCSWASGPVRFTSPAYGTGRLDWGCHELLPLPASKNWTGEISLKAHVSVQDATVEVVFANRAHQHADDFGLGPFRTFRPRQGASGDPAARQVLRLSLPASTSKAELIRAIESAQGTPVSRLWRFARTLDVGGRLACSLPQTPRHLLVEVTNPGFYDEDDEEEDASSGTFAMLTKWSLGESTGTSRQNFFRLFAETVDVSERSQPSFRYAGRLSAFPGARRTSSSMDTTVPSASVGTAASGDEMDMDMDMEMEDLELEGEDVDFSQDDLDDAVDASCNRYSNNSSSSNTSNNNSNCNSNIMHLNATSSSSSSNYSHDGAIGMDVDGVGDERLLRGESAAAANPWSRLDGERAEAEADPEAPAAREEEDEEDLDDEETATWNRVRVFVKTFHHGDSLHFAQVIDVPRSEDARKLLRSILAALQMAPTARQHYAMVWEGCPSDWAEPPPGCRPQGKDQIPFDPNQEIVNGHGVVLQGDILVLAPRDRLKELAQLYHFQYQQRVKAFQRLASAELAQAGRCTFASLCEVMDSLNVDAWRLEQLLSLPQTEGSSQVGVGMGPQRPLLALMQMLPGLHPQFFCDSCGTRDLRGDRYNCSVCSDFDLCEACYKAQPEALVTRDPAGRCHQRCHRMTCTRPALPADCLSQA